LICTIYEFKYVIGGIPILGTNWEEDRFVSASGYIGRLIHIISYSFIPLAMVIQAALFSQKKILTLKNSYYFIMLFLSLSVCAMWGSRHTIFIPLTVGVVLFHYLHYRLYLRHFIFLGLIGLIFVGGIGYLRTSTIWEDLDIDYTEVLQELGYEGRYPIFDQAHNTIAINFETFHWLTDTVPDSINYQYGKFTFFPFYSLLPGKQDTLGEWQNNIWNTGFYANLTSTFMGPLYVDFGLLGIFLFTFIFSIFITLLYKNMHKHPTMFNILIFAFFVNHIVMMPYDNTLIKLHFFFNLLFLWFTDLYCRKALNKSNISEGDV
jgi:oligosaccharide repeat unit polymerase